MLWRVRLSFRFELGIFDVTYLNFASANVSHVVTLLLRTNWNFASAMARFEFRLRAAYWKQIRKLVIRDVCYVLPSPCMVCK
jgi:hypothetical protein